MLSSRKLYDIIIKLSDKVRLAMSVAFKIYPFAKISFLIDVSAKMLHHYLFKYNNYITIVLIDLKTFPPESFDLSLLIVLMSKKS